MHLYKTLPVHEFLEHKDKTFPVDLKGLICNDTSSPQFSFLTFEGEEIASISFLSTNFKIKIRQQNQYAEPKKVSNYL